MGFLVFLVIAGAIVVGIIVAVKMFRKKKTTEGLKRSGGYEVALQIKDELAQKGFEISCEKLAYNGDGNADYGFDVRYESELVGGVNMHHHIGSLAARMSSMYTKTSLSILCRQKNADAHRTYKGGYYYSIYNDNINLLAYSQQKTQEVPTFLEIVANVMSNSQYEFHHPEYMFENPEMKEYLNVMFQD